ncbi:hypothetical protein AA0472_0101 [Acetobacter estunensis NRIC 0472]|uniref:Uncharacterized protein n=1 Tax=Acetobacter estunensis TaxID=104097 RepID=A0A967B4E2_9PROT|nr:hypothetical protein [Acetobacter estunensis]NHO53547.1 hypothetical protein [Acetobacter estunensis]GBQ20312.1 hypothetical protein AA0472_0101 [Acetobacter estunensis NRIC 0472]
MTSEDSKTSEQPASTVTSPGQITFRAVAWLVQPTSGEGWVDATDPERYRSLGYAIMPLVREDQALNAIKTAVEAEHEVGVQRHARDLIALASVVHRLKTILNEGYDYDREKIRADLVGWGYIEPDGEDGERAVETPEGHRLAAVMELEWLKASVERKTDRHFLRAIAAMKSAAKTD